MWTERRFVSFDGTPIFYRWLNAAHPGKACVVMLHGMGEHGGRYKPLAEYLAGLGLDCILPDLRGFGESGGSRGCVKHFSDFYRDLDAVLSWVEKERAGQSIILLGHSFGGLISASYLAFFPQDRVKALVLTSPLFAISLPVPFWRHCLGLFASVVAPNYVQNNLVDAAILTHDKTRLEAHRRDRLIHYKVSARLYGELCRIKAKRKEIAGKIKIPVLLLQAGDDKVVSKESALSFFKELASKDKELKVYPDMFHEILNEVGRDEVFHRIGDWILTQLK